MLCREPAKSLKHMYTLIERVGLGAGGEKGGESKKLPDLGIKKNLKGFKR